jgi:hypothetical protein
VRGDAAPASAARTSWSLSTLQEQMIMQPNGANGKPNGWLDRATQGGMQKKNEVYSVSKLSRCVVFQ